MSRNRLRTALRCAAFSFMEVIIAVALLATVMALAMESLMAGQNYDQFSSLQDDLALESTRILSHIRNDLTVSGWEFPTQPLADYKVNATTDRTLRYYPFVQIQSHDGTTTTQGLGAAAEYGWSHRPAHKVVLGGTPGSPSPTNWHTIGRSDLEIGEPDDFGRTAASAYAAAVSRGAAIGSVDAYWHRSFFARSQEILFLRSTVSTWDERTETVINNLDQPPLLSFKGIRQQWSTPAYHDQLNILRAAGWYAIKDGSGAVLSWAPYPIPGSSSSTASTYPYGAVMDAGYLVEPDASISTIGVNWRTTDGSTFNHDTDSAADMNAYAAKLRVYAYCVIPSQLGFGRLVRAMRSNDATTRTWGTDVGNKISESGSSCMVIERVLSDHVMRICFDTYRTLPVVSSAEINEVRVRLYMGARADTGTTITRLFETTVCMRSRNTQADKEIGGDSSLAAILGESPVGINR
jgi:type II secretory pathway pseudopilin PulG